MFRSVLLAVLWSQQAAAPITLQRVVDTYIQRNLDLQTAKYRLERTRADLIAARLRPNPSLTIGTENFAFSGPTPFSQLYELSATYSETIELGGKRKLRESVADLTISAAEAQFADSMRRGVAEVKRLYLSALLARYQVDAAKENRQTFDQLLQFNLARFQQGAIPEADLIKVRLERVKFDSAIRQAELNLRQATIRVLEQLGDSTFAAQDVVGDLNVNLVNADADQLRQTALRERPDVRAAERELAAAAERITLEHARSRPDVTPFVGYKRLATDNSLSFGITVPIKTRDRNEAGISRAETDEKMAQTQVQAVRNRVLAEVEMAYEAFQTARQQVQTFRNDLLNQADESRSIALAAYQQGASELLPVLEAQRTRAEVRQEYFQTLFDYQTSLIALELAIGRDVQP